MRLVTSDKARHRYSSLKRSPQNCLICCLPLRSGVRASLLLVRDCAYNSSLATATCCPVYNFVDHCAGAKGTENPVLASAKRSVGRLSVVVISNAPSELDLVIVYAKGRGKCCENAIATVIVQEMGCGVAFSVQYLNA